MNKKHLLFLLSLVLLLVNRGFTQNNNHTKKWCFGNYVGLDFMTTPPTPFTSSIIATFQGCSSVADNNGNLLFYTNSMQVWNKNHVVMANGSGLLGDISSSQAALAVKQPGNNNIYYVFTLDNPGGFDGLRYSIVDMNLAAGDGSVTTKNTLVFSPSSGNLTATRHCNGTDIWIISHQWNNNSFACYLLSSTGLSNSPVISQIGSARNFNFSTIGQIKVSPNGKRIGSAGHGATGGFTEIFDFDNSTGQITNQMIFGNTDRNLGAEFSPDGTKFYVTEEITGPTAITNTYNIHQWDLCASTTSQVIASKYQVVTTNSIATIGMQLAHNGTIYVSSANSLSIGVISNPNLQGSSSSFNVNGQLVSSGLPIQAAWFFPGFICSDLREPAPPFTYTASCQTLSFTSSVGHNTLYAVCPASGYAPPLSTWWNFGEPTSGSSNTASVNNPSHYYSSTGTYTVKQALNYNCFTDTITQVINVSVPGPSFAVSGPTAMCTGEKPNLTLSAVQNYSWSGISFTLAANGSSAVISPTANTQYTIVATNSVSGCTYKKTHSITVNKCLGINSSNTAMQGISVYPNPTNGDLYIDAEINLYVAIFNQLGELIEQKEIKSGLSKIEISKYSSGIYFLRAANQQNSKVIKVVKVEY